MRPLRLGLRLPPLDGIRAFGLLSQKEQSRVVQMHALRFGLRLLL